MGVRNVLIEGVSATGKTSVCHALRKRGFHALNGDRDLACKGDPTTGVPVSEPEFRSEQDRAAWLHRHQIWDFSKAEAMVRDRRHGITFYCGGARNRDLFIELFDVVLVLNIDRDTLEQRLAERPEDEFGGRMAERDLVLRLHQTEEDLPITGIRLDATRPLSQVVDDILKLSA